MEKIHLNKGIQLALVTMVISGLSIFVNKFAVDAIQTPLVFTMVKNTLVGLFLFLYLMKAHKVQKIKTLKREDVRKLVIIGLVGGSIPFYLFFTGLSMTPAVNAAIIHKTLIFWVALLAIPFLGEKISGKQIAAVVILFLSNALIGGFKGLTFSTGELMIFGATLLWAVENIIAKKMLKKIDTDIIAGARMIFGSALLIIATVIMYPDALFQIGKLGALQWFWIAVTATLLAGYVLSWYRALAYAPAITVTTILVGSTVMTNMLSALYITHTWNLDMTLQSVIIAGAIAVYVLSSKKALKKAL